MGRTASRTGHNRAYELCQQIGTTPQLFPVLRGLQVFHMTRTEYATARQLAERLLHLAQPLQDPALLVGAHLAVGQTLFFIGESPRPGRIWNRGSRCTLSNTTIRAGLGAIPTSSVWGMPRGHCGFWAIQIRP